MAYTFTDGVMATASHLNQSIGPTLATGIAKVTPVANELTSKRIIFPGEFIAEPHIQLTPASTVAGSTVKGWSIARADAKGFDVWVYRTNTTNTYFHWVACLSPNLFATGDAVAASMLNQGAGGMVCQSGIVSITPSSAGAPKSANITFPSAFASTALVYTTALSSTPSDILGTGATSPTATGCKIWLTRANTTATQVQWIAVGRM